MKAIKQLFAAAVITTASASAMADAATACRAAGKRSDCTGIHGQ